MSDVAHVKGNQNVVTDCLSRPANAITIDICDLPELVNHQASDEEIVHFKDQLKPYAISDSSTILCDVSLPYPRPFVTKKLRKSVFN